MKWNIRQWSERYIPSEISGTILAVISALTINKLTGNLVLTAFAGTWGENVGYYGSIFVRDYIKHSQKTSSNRCLHSVKVIRNMIFEFGPAEILDSFIVRPYAMFIFPIIINNLALGIFTGKIFADIIFYIPTIISYELRKKHFK